MYDSLVGLHPLPTLNQTIGKKEAKKLYWANEKTDLEVSAVNLLMFYIVTKALKYFTFLIHLIHRTNEKNLKLNLEAFVSWQVFPAIKGCFPNKNSFIIWIFMWNINLV